MVVFLEYLHKHVFIYIAFSFLVAAVATAFLTHYEQTSGKTWCSAKSASIDFFRISFPLFLILGSFLGIWSWVVFFPLGFGHRDEIALLTEPLKPTIYSGRFFPLGHMEFNFLSLQLFEGELGFLYLLPLVQVILFSIFVEKIVNPSSLSIRIFALCASFWLSALVPLSNLIVPERNAILLLLAGMFFIKRYYVVPSLGSAVAGVGFATLALYYKEPIFSLLLTFAFVLIIYRRGSITHYSKGWRGVFGPIEVGLIISSLFFLIGYFFYVYFNGAPVSYYSNGASEIHRLEWICYFLITNPILLLLLISMLGAHFLIPRDAFDRAFAAGLASGGAIYLLALIVIGLPVNGYYYSLPLLSMVISSAIVLKYISVGHVNSISVNAIHVLMLGAIAVVVFRQSEPIINDIVDKKNYQSEYSFLKSETKYIEQVRSVYYFPRTELYNTYATAVLMTFLHKTNISHSFNIYSNSGCDAWNASYNSDRIRCIKENFRGADKYDVIIVENDSVSEIDNSKYRSIRFASPFEGVFCDSVYSKASLAHKPFVECSKIRNTLTVATRFGGN